MLGLGRIPRSSRSNRVDESKYHLQWEKWMSGEEVGVSIVSSSEVREADIVSRKRCPSALNPRFGFSYRMTGEARGR